jgi:hypothetical protein
LVVVGMADEEALQPRPRGGRVTGSRLVGQVAEVGITPKVVA